jgi:hypothetical protein
MIKLLLLSLTINYITSEQILTIYPQKKRVMNSDEGGKIPLIVKPSEDVNEEIEFTCNSNICYTFWGSTSEYDVFDEEILPKIPAGTKAGTEIKFNCILIEPVYNDAIALLIHENFLIDVVEDNFIYFENMKWKNDENNKKIEFVPKFVVNPSYSTSKNLEKNDKIYLDITLMEDITNEISIADETFILNKEEENGISINLISCSKIQKNAKKGNIKITCSVEKEAKDGKFMLKLGQGKKIDNIEPKVSGYVTFSADGPTRDGLITDEGMPTQAEDSTNYSNILKISLIILILLF